MSHTDALIHIPNEFGAVSAELGIPAKNMNYDVIVVGAGLGGLSTAAHLSKAGKSVLVLENHAVPGGFAHEFRRGKFRFEVSLHALDGAGPGGWAYPVLKDLEVLSQVNFQRLDPFYGVKFPEHHLDVPADPIEYEAELIRRFPHEAAGLRSLFESMGAVFDQFRRYMVDEELGLLPATSKTPATYPAMLESMAQTWQQFMDRHVGDGKLKAILSALWGYFALPPSELSAAANILPLVSYHRHGAYYPEGGSMAMSRALEKTVRRYGGQILYRRRVTKLETTDGRVTGVCCDNGERYTADVVVSNASPKATLLSLVDQPALIPANQRRALEDTKPSLGSLTVYLGLDDDPAAHWDHHELLVSNSYDLESAHRASVEGRFDEADIMITRYNGVDPTCAPDGGSVMSIFALASWDHADVWGTGGDVDGYSKNPKYHAAKDAAAEQLLRQAERHVPGLRKRVRHMVVGTPLTNARYTLNPRGAIYGSDHTVANTFIGRQGASTSIPNLFLAGAWTRGGGQSAALLSGREASDQVLERLDGQGPRRRGLLAEAPATESTPAGAPNTTVERAPRKRIESKTGTAVPALTAVGTGRVINLRELGVPAILVFHTQETTGAFNRVNRIVRRRHPDAANLLTGSVVNLAAVPDAFRPIAEQSLETSYEKSAAKLRDGAKPEDSVVILPDWSGDAARALGLAQLEQQAAVVAVDGRGGIVDVFQGDEIKPGTLRLLERLFSG